MFLQQASYTPSFGGLGLSLSDVRVLRDQLLSHENWDDAGAAYAAEHDQYYSVIHTMELWQTQLLLETGPDADARRQRTFAAWQEDRTRHLDVLMSGPGPPLDETVRRRFFGKTNGWPRRCASVPFRHPERSEGSQGWFSRPPEIPHHLRWVRNDILQRMTGTEEALKNLHIELVK